MRRLLALAILAGACSTAAPKKNLSDLEVDVLWEEEPIDTIVVASQQSEAEEPASVSATPSITETFGPALHTSTYHLTYKGRRIGEAREVFHRSDSGVRILRHEKIRIKRNGVPVDSETQVRIHTDKRLRAIRVELEARAGAVTRKGQATRADDGSWVVALDGETVRREDAKAIPLELVPYLLSHQERAGFRGKVLLAGYGFAVTNMRLAHKGRRGTAVLETEWGDIETELKLAGDGRLVRAATGSTGSVRVKEERMKEDFERPELLGANGIAISGHGQVLLVEGVTRQPPPAITGQAISLLNKGRDKGWRIQFDQKAPRVSKRVSDLAREVDALLQDANDAPGAGAGDALALGRGDCTAHATLFVDMAADVSIEAHLVTGYRIEEGKMRRHRWVAVKDGKRWTQVDPTFGEAPASPGKHLALAVHGDSTAQIALVDEAVFRGLDHASARWVTGAVATR